MEITLFLILSLYLVIGFFIAHRVGKGTKLWVRIVLLSPMLTACLMMISLLEGTYQSHFADIVREIGWVCTYILLALLLTGKRLLINIDNCKNRKDEQ